MSVTDWLKAVQTKKGNVMNIIEFLTNKGYQLKKNSDGTFSGPCPFCGGNDRFTVFPNSGKWGGVCTCRKCKSTVCGKLKTYNFADLLMLLDNLTESEALNIAKASSVAAVTDNSGTVHPMSSVVNPDHQTWSSFMEGLTISAQQELLSNGSNWALNYLVNDRHLRLETIQALKLGYIPVDASVPAEKLGFTDGTKVTFFEGIFIPARDAEGRIIAVDLRRKAGCKPKHFVIRGSQRRPEILWGNKRALVLVESYLDAALIWQDCKDLCSVGVLYSAQMKATPEFAAAVKDFPVVIYAGDTDEAGANGFVYWHRNFRARRWLIPAKFGKDPCEGVDNGLNIREWVVAALSKYPILYPDLVPAIESIKSPDAYAADSLSTVDTPHTVERRVLPERDSKTSEQEYTFTSITESSEIVAAIEYLSAYPELALDTETYSEVTPRDATDIPALDPRRNKVRLVTLTAGDRTYAFDIKRLGGAPQALVALIASKVIIGHNLKFDLESMLCDFGLVILPKHCFDTMIAAQLINKATEVGQPAKGCFSLATLCSKYLWVNLDKEEQASDWSGELTDSQLIYAANDTAYLHPLKDALIDELLELGFSGEVVDTEMDFVICLSKVEQAGIPTNIPGIQNKLSELEADYTVQERVWSEAHNNVNPNSPKQLMALFEDTGHKLPDTSKTTLAQHSDNSTVASLIALRSLKHPIDYLRKTLQIAVGNLVYPRFQQIAAPTGRMSSTGLNMQAIPSGLRDLYACPSAGWSIVKCDYPAIELRIGSVVTQEHNLIECFQAGKDPHAMMAAKIKGVPVESIGKDSADRKKAKAANFGFLYGMGAATFREYALSYGASFTIDEAEDFKADYLDLYQSIADWQKDTGNALRESDDGTIERVSLAGRVMRADTYCSALNYAVQGTGADMIKKAVILIDEAFTEQSLKARIINIVHDDIRVLCPDEEVEKVKAILVEKMGAVADALLPDFKTLPDPEVISSR